MSQSQNDHQDGTVDGSQVPVVHSSAAFLHHLHTDPTSHHITLSGTPAGKHGQSVPNKSPRSISIPLEPTVVERNKPLVSPSKAATLATASAREIEPIAGPSNQKTLGRNLSKRGRPKTAPTRNYSNPGTPGVHSPDMDDAGRMDEYPFDSTSYEDLPQLAAEGENVMDDDELQARDIMTDLDQDTDNRRGSTVLGQAGSMDPNALRSIAASPVEQLGWTTFAKSYAHGLFDPHKIPIPPRSSDSPVGTPLSVQSSPGKAFAPVPMRFANRPSAIPSTSVSSQGTGGSSASTSSAFTKSTSSSSVPTTASISAMNSSLSLAKPVPAAGSSSKTKSLELAHLPESNSTPQIVKPDKLVLPSYSLAAATVRMASSALRDSDFAPLGIPSPERELLDPMSSVVSNDSPFGKSSATSDPGSSRFPLSRSMSSAVTSTHLHQSLLPIIQASPVSTPGEMHKGKGRAIPELESSYASPPGSTGSVSSRGGALHPRIPAATAPLEKTWESEAYTDYFGPAVNSLHPHFDRQQSHTSQSSGSQQTVTNNHTPALGRLGTPNFSTAQPSPGVELPPAATPHEIGDLYDRLGWLPALNPPNEIARRKALYRFGILYTSSDVNFDRIAHMAKLVFNTKLVLIALTDVDKQWNKSRAGSAGPKPMEESPRISSFCSHALLSKTGEPFVVLNAEEDWRFAKNPQVVGPPHIRFYAGAPLRTSDGYNVGTLCLIDDKPHADFPPRSRLILKEFAAVAMREMELWRDKVSFSPWSSILCALLTPFRSCSFEFEIRYKTQWRNSPGNVLRWTPLLLQTLRPQLAWIRCILEPPSLSVQHLISMEVSSWILDSLK